MTARRAWISADPVNAAGDLREAMGDQADAWVRSVATELGAAVAPQLVIELSNVPNLVDELGHVPNNSARRNELYREINRTVSAVVAVLVGA